MDMKLRSRVATVKNKIEVAIKAHEYSQRQTPELRYRLYRMGCWITAGHEVIQVEKIGNLHLSNIYHFLYRHAEKKCAATSAWYASCAGPQGEMAQYCFDQECERVWDASPMDYMLEHPFTEHLLREMRSRGMMEDQVDVER